MSESTDALALVLSRAEIWVERAKRAESERDEYAQHIRSLRETVTMLRQEFAEMQQRAETAEAMAIRWIPVAEALPPTELRVLACYNDGRATMTLRALYIPPHTVLSCGDYEEPEYDSETDESYFPGGWYEAVEEGEYAFIGPLSGTVTHWAQLPALPAVQS